MSATAKKRPLAGSATSRVWEIADEMLRQSGVLPSGRAVVDRYVAEGYNEGTGFTQYSHWKKARALHFKRGPRGLGHAGESALEPAHAAITAPARIERVKLRIGADGRLLIPAELRSRMRLDPEGYVSASIEDGVLLVQSLAVGIAKAQAMVRAHIKPGPDELGDFLRDRRASWGEE